MGYKAFGTNDNETVKHWSDQTDVVYQQETAYKEGRDCSTTAGKCKIQTKTDLESVKTKGDRVRIITIDNLRGDGAVGDRLVVGQEESIRTSNVDLVIDQLRHGGMTDGNMSNKRTCIDQRKVLRDGLGGWLTRKIDGARRLVEAGLYPSEVNNVYDDIFWRDDIFRQHLGLVVTAPDATHRFWGGTHTTDATLTYANDIPTAAAFSALKVKMSKMVNPPKPYMINGRPFYEMSIDEEIFACLEQDATFRDAFKYGAPRGEDNPLLTGVYGTYKGFLFRLRPQLCNVATGAANDGKVKRIIVNGADDMLEAWAKPEQAADGRFSWYEDTGDAGARKMIYTGTMYGLVKNTYTPQGGTAQWRNGIAWDVCVSA